MTSQYTLTASGYGNSGPVHVLRIAQINNKRAGTPDIAMEGGMMNLVQTIPVTGVLNKDGSNEFVTVALFVAVGLLTGLVAAMNGIAPVVPGF
jgi:hypothetical protein